MAAQTSAPATTIANPQAWHHAMLGGVAVFLVLGVLGALVFQSPVFAIAPLGGFAGSAAAALLAERAATHWPWYAYVVMPLGTVGILPTLLALAS
jgi:hypothetical protein